MTLKLFDLIFIVFKLRHFANALALIKYVPLGIVKVLSEVQL